MAAHRNSKIRVYDYWRSSASYRVRIVLGLAGLEWESVAIDLVAGEQRESGHLKRNAQGLVPVIELDDTLLSQSLAIIEYLDETRSLGLLPEDPVSRARVRALSYAIAMEIHPVCNLRVARFATDHSGGNIDTKTWMQHFIGAGLADFEALLEGGRFCFGDTVTMADICLMPQIYNSIRWEVDMTPFRKIGAIVKHLELLPAFRAAHPEAVRR
ncbi:maleylacetoacetate isomerase [Mesorhizobium sp. DCY119]|uniref:maleylacetoacetate isomerase n=1 Tax=Mesorhizobium sp. DCY119 TaxID=2108445 RepID=UPI000E6C0FF3|nr:maleylacetoacetate isomerase [Mesorhizobium sp. DCY119]RJG46163.1 maleylacetoacetate isomerase [Mesorhizobium sp. DCY119]